MKRIYHWLNDFFNLIYPRLCLICGSHLSSKKQAFCITCTYKLPKTNFHIEKENLFTERLWGRLPIHTGTACYHFITGGRTQKLIHQLKYKGKKDIGIQIGRTYGKLLRNTPHFESIDIIIPVPLHPRKEHQRGYNQSWLFAKGLSESMYKPCLKNGLKRSSYANSQTTKSRMERLENVLKAFEVENAKALLGKHILLVDDVLTTGATLEACGIKILELEGTKLSMVTIAISN